MRRTCPSCFLYWKDEEDPEDAQAQTICHFCWTRRTEKELLNWQLQQLENINPKKLPIVLRYMIRNLEKRIEELENEK